jgi:DNA polymerase I
MPKQKSEQLEQKKKVFVLIDGHALIYRAFHAFQDLTTPEGVPINAVYGFCRILLTVIRELQPEYILVAFDHAKPTFRHSEFLGYKANRVEMPAELPPQIDKIKEIVTAFNIPQFELAGYEADDLIGTLVRQIEERPENKQPQIMTLIVTGDRDAFQLVSDKTHVWMPGRSKPVRTTDMEYDPAGVEKKMGVRPDQIVDLKSLMGDASDNIPGVKGIGEKTAVKLIQHFGTMKEIYETIEREQLLISSSKHEILKGNVLKKLAEGYQDAVMSQKLAQIDQYSPITLELDHCRLAAYRKDDVIKIFEELHFTSLMSSLPADEFELEVQGALF